MPAAGSFQEKIFLLRLFEEVVWNRTSTPLCQNEIVDFFRCPFVTSRASNILCP